ncbi:unnamed protein product [Plutella xylostella]|uniref:Cleavage and polyadenylation specificity factor subunit 2 n=1 Tax=Plutella xylostella TaxID=51655 RepID=A0A8S4DSF9_PLUXY|nr:unnamed protein product [Plutella xylostella]
MTSIIKLTCLSGVIDESPPCYVLQIDEFKILLDCGWDEKFDIDFIKDLKRHINSIDAVLLSHSDPMHLGALPYAIGKLGLNCPVYATLPVYKMGQMFMYDLYQAHRNVSEFDLFTLDDVDNAFDRIVQLKYNQTIDMKGKGLGIRIVPLPAGHTLGGTVWRISAPGEEDIVYAPDFNHKKERHLNGCEVERLLRPSLMLVGAMNANHVQQRRRLRDEKLMTTILSGLRGGGCVLVCTDTAGRVLELAHMLDQLWRNRDSGLTAYSLLLLSNVTYNVLEFAKSQASLMSARVGSLVRPAVRNRDSGLTAYSLLLLSNVTYNVLEFAKSQRVLELAHMLDQLWRNRDSGLTAYSLLLLSNVTYNVLELAKSQIEWMSNKMTRAFEGARSNPFALRHVQLCHSAAEVHRTPGPKSSGQEGVPRCVCLFVVSTRELVYPNGYRFFGRYDQPTATSACIF